MKGTADRVSAAFLTSGYVKERFCFWKMFRITSMLYLLYTKHFLFCNGFSQLPEYLDLIFYKARKRKNRS
jgi:hypothetical protein